MFFRFPGRVLFAVFAFVAIVFNERQTIAIDPEQNAATAPVESAPVPNLAATQESIEMRYRRFEGTLLQLSEYLRKTDPGRAELLLRASGKSKESRIPEQFQKLTDLLKKDQLGDAVERQELVVAELQSILELLMSEARKDDLEREKKRIQELIKDVNKLIGKETDARANTERGGSNSDLQSQQKKVADSAKNLVEKMNAQDAGKNPRKDEGNKSGKEPKTGGKPDKKPGTDGERKPGDKDESDSKDEDKSKPDGNEGSPQSPNDPKNKNDEKPDDADGKEQKPGTEDQKPDDAPKPGDPKSGKPKDGRPQPGKPSRGKPKAGKPKDGKPKESKPQDGKPQDGKPQDGQPQEGEQPQENQDQNEQQDHSQQNDESKEKTDKTAGRDEIERAKQEMDRAIEELKKNNKKGASDKQDKAIAELLKAREKLEEILRQLREEERELVLTKLEARFRDMLLRQEAVNNATLAIHVVPVDSRTDRHRNRAVELARSEDEISILAAKALTLLKEEGSSIAFPEAVEQIRDDMLTIVKRLDQADVGEITQNIEQDLVEGLKELIEALQKEIEKAKDKKQQPPQSPQEKQEQQKQGLVNKLAELKMLRSLQFRVNRRTKQLGRLVDGEQATESDVVGQLKQLSERQSKVQRATYDLSTGKNQ